MVFLLSKVSGKTARKIGMIITVYTGLLLLGFFNDFIILNPEFSVLGLIKLKIGIFQF